MGKSSWITVKKGDSLESKSSLENLGVKSIWPNRHPIRQSEPKRLIAALWRHGFFEGLACSFPLFSLLVPHLPQSLLLLCQNIPPFTLAPARSKITNTSSATNWGEKWKANQCGLLLLFWLMVVPKNHQRMIMADAWPSAVTGSFHHIILWLLSASSMASLSASSLRRWRSMSMARLISRNEDNLGPLHLGPYDYDFDDTN